jgi:hypothetical protein
VGEKQARAVGTFKKTQNSRWQKSCAKKTQIHGWQKSCCTSGFFVEVPVRAAGTSNKNY